MEKFSKFGIFKLLWRSLQVGWWAATGPRIDLCPSHRLLNSLFIFVILDGSKSRYQGMFVINFVGLGEGRRMFHELPSAPQLLIIY